MQFVWASALGYCPLKSYFSRSGTEPKFPLTRDEAFSSEWRMRNGVKTAEIIQEAMWWKFGFTNCEDGITEAVINGFFSNVDSDYRTCLIEHPVHGDEALPISGRVDLAFRTGSDVHLVEIKGRNVQEGSEKAFPKLGDAMQVLSYKMMLARKYPHLTFHAHVLIGSWYFFNLWSFEDSNGGYTLHCEDGDVWNYQGAPCVVYTSDVHRECERHLAYLKGERSDVPYPDFINDPIHRWECGQWVNGKTPKKYKKLYRGAMERTEQIKRRCPYFCHTDQPGPWDASETEPESGKYVVHFEPKF
jgi:hypothetical protein